MSEKTKPHVLVLGGNFAGLTAARFIRDACGEDIRMTLIDQKSYLIFIPNIPLEVFANQDPDVHLHLPIVPILNEHDIDFILARVLEIDPETKQVTFCPSERPGAATETIGYDYLVIALGAQLAYSHIKGFGEFGHTLSDSYYGNRFRKYLFEGQYKGGPIAVGSALFHQGTKGKPGWLPVSPGACEGPPLEISLSMATWLQERNLGGPENITMFTPGRMIAEDAGEEIVHEFLDMAKNMGFGYKNNTQDIKEITSEGIEFANGDQLEAELKIVMPDWVPFDFMKALPIVDEPGFVITDLTMRNPDYPEIMAVGDCAALTVPKLGSLGHKQAEIVGRQIAKDIGKMKPEKANQVYRPEVICFGDMGGNKGFYIHSDTWFGGDTSVFKVGYTYFAMKIAFKELYYRTGGKPPGWGIPMAELVADHLSV